MEFNSTDKRNHPTINYGFVGDVKKVNTIIRNVAFNWCSCILCITHDEKGQLLNTNADTIASELAIALSEVFDVTLNYCFEKTRRFI
jgi:acetylglutamate kinase